MNLFKGERDHRDRKTADLDGDQTNNQLALALGGGRPKRISELALNLDHIA